jgi:hypothetical protein
MKPRHAAALALVGWALIFLPMLGDRVDIGAPVNEWDVMGKGFASVHACEQFRTHGRIMQYGNLTDPRSVALVKAFPQRRAASRCTPDDDPRLKTLSP